MTEEIMRALLTVGIALIALGASAALASSNVMKRLGAALVAHVGAILALAALAAPTVLLVTAAAAAMAYLAIGVALLVRAQEAYGAIEAVELDGADALRAREPARDA